MSESTVHPEPAAGEQVGGSLKARVIRGGLWVAALKGTSRGLGFVRTLILARLLMPKDFGILGIALLAIGAINTFTETGFSAALVQKKEDIEEYLDTCWTIQAIRGFVLAAILFFAAPLVARFFESPASGPVLQVLAISVALSGLQSARTVYYQRELLFDRQFAQDVVSTVADLAVSVTLALAWRNVWALVYGSLAGSAVGLIASYLLQPQRPRLRVDPKAAADLWRFGRWVLGSSALVFLVTNLDNAVVGKLLGESALGLYAMAYTISNLPATEITQVFNRVAFPAFARMQQDLPRIRAAYFYAFRYMAALVLPSGVFLALMAPDLVRVVLGDKWMQAVPALRVLAVYGIVRAVASANGPLVLGLGRPDVDTKIMVIKLLGMGSIIYPLVLSDGIRGVAIAVLAPVILSQTYGFTMAARLLRCGTASWLQAAAPAALVALLLGAALFGVSHALGPLSHALCLLSAAGLTGLAITSSVWWGLRHRFAQSFPGGVA